MTSNQTKLKPWSEKHYQVGVWLVFIGCMASLSWLSGCSDNRRSGGQGRNESVQREVENGVDFIRAAFNYTLDTQRFDSDGFKSGMVESLDNWIRNVQAGTDWKPDPMLAGIDEKYKTLPSVAAVSDMKFQLNDADFFQEAIWLKSVTRVSTSFCK